MSAHKLQSVVVEKPWGRWDVPARFGGSSDRRIGEIWFTDASAPPLPLLVKYLFTSEKLSIQVHPNDQQAKHVGLSGGKSECWYVLNAESYARLGIGLRDHAVIGDLRKAALDGSIEELIDWKPVRPGSFFYIPAGTIHAIGGGITLVEVQQNNDVTYRLFDYGRPRELHLDDGLAVSLPTPYHIREKLVSAKLSERLVERTQSPFVLDTVALAKGESFKVSTAPAWFIPLEGTGKVDGTDWSAGECWYLDAPCVVSADGDAHFFIAWHPDHGATAQ